MQMLPHNYRVHSPHFWLHGNDLSFHKLLKLPGHPVLSVIPVGIERPHFCVVNRHIRHPFPMLFADGFVAVLQIAALKDAKKITGKRVMEKATWICHQNI